MQTGAASAGSHPRGRVPGPSYSVSVPNARPAVILRGKVLRRDRAAVMAIVNRTPDSFYDRGATFADDAARAAVDRAVADGADLVDIGGVKAGVGPEVSAGQEIDRVVPFIAEVRGRYPDLPISVDTWRAEVADAACAAGADLVNDTWAGADPELGRSPPATAPGSSVHTPAAPRRGPTRCGSPTPMSSPP